MTTKNESETGDQPTLLLPEAPKEKIGEETKVSPHDLILRTIDNDEPQFHIVRFGQGDGKPRIYLLERRSSDHGQLDTLFRRGLLMGVPAVPAGDGAACDAVDMTFRLDLARLGQTVDNWQKQRLKIQQSQRQAAPERTGEDAARDATIAEIQERLRRRMLSLPDDPHDRGMVRRDRKGSGINAGRYDVVFDWVNPVPEPHAGDGGAPRVYIVHCNEKSPHQPFADPQYPERDVVEEMTNPSQTKAITNVFKLGTFLTFLQQTNLPIGFSCYLMNTSKFWTP